MAAIAVLKKIVVWIAVLQENEMAARFKSEDNDLTFPYGCLFYDVPVRSYKVRNLQQRGRNLVFLMSLCSGVIYKFCPHGKVRLLSLCTAIHTDDMCYFTGLLDCDVFLKGD